MLFFWLLNYLQKEYNPDLFAVEVWDKQRIQNRTQQNKTFLDAWILDKLDFIENSESSVLFRRFNQLLAVVWFDKYKKYFKIFWGWEVLDESRKFPHNGRNLPLLHHYSIRKWQFILVWWIGTHYKKSTKYLYKYLLPKAQKIICRELDSVKRAKKYSLNNTLLFQDFSTEILDKEQKKQTEGSKSLSSLEQSFPIVEEGSKSLSSLEQSFPIVEEGSKSLSSLEQSFPIVEEGSKSFSSFQNVYLINIGPKHFTQQNLNKIKKYIKASTDVISAHPVAPRKIFFPADINFDKQYYPQLRKEIPDLEIYDRTKHSLFETIELFKSCSWWVWSRLHFLYPLKVFKKDLLSISDSDKVRKMI